MNDNLIKDITENTNMLQLSENDCVYLLSIFSFEKSESTDEPDKVIPIVKAIEEAYPGIVKRNGYEHLLIDF